MAVLDFASREAKRSQYCSRAAVKLEQLLLKFPKVLSSLQKGKVEKKCVDLGCHPGSWLQVLSRKIKKAEIYGFDLKRNRIVGEFEVRGRTSNANVSVRRV